MEKSCKKIVLRFISFLILITLILLTEGCVGKSEVEELAFVIAIGVDKGKVPDKHLITFQVALPATGGDGIGSDMKNWTISMEVNSVTEVAENINQILNKQIFMGTTRIIIISEDLAREGINGLLDSFERYYQFRRTIYLLVAKGEAKDILNTKVRASELPSLNLLDTIKGQQRISTYPVTRIGHYFTVLGRESQNPLVPIVEKIKPGDKGIDYSDENGEELLIHNCGIFEDGKLIGFLNDQETNGYLWLDNEVKSRFIETKQKDLGISVWVLNSSTKYQVEPEGENMEITFKIKAKVSLASLRGQQEKLSTQEWGQFIKDLEPKIAEEIMKECEAAVNKSKKLRRDFIGIGRKIEIKNPKYWKQVRDQWPNQISDVPVSYDIEVIIEHTGLPMYNPVSPQKSRQ